MVTTYKQLVSPKFVDAAQTSQYICPTSVSRSIIYSASARNTSAGSQTITVFIVYPSSSPGNLNSLASITLEAGESYQFPELIGQVLISSAIISTTASASNAINLAIAGAEIS